MVHRYVNSAMSKITGGSDKGFDEDEAREKFQEAHSEDKSGDLKLDEEKFVDLLDKYWIKAKIAGMQEERAKGESSDNLYNLVALAMLASVLNTLISAAIAYSVFG